MTTDRYIPWQERHPPLPPTMQSTRAAKSMQPLGATNRAQRRQPVVLHSANYHQKTRGKARTRLDQPVRCRCAKAANWWVVVKGKSQ